MGFLIFSLSIWSVIFNQLSIDYWNFFFLLDFFNFCFGFSFTWFFNFFNWFFNFLRLFRWEWSETLFFFFSNINVLQLLLELFNFFLSLFLSIKIINDFISSFIISFFLLFFFQFLLLFLLLKLKFFLFFLSKLLIELINCWFVLGLIFNFVFWKHISFLRHILFVIDYICKGFIPLFNSILHLCKLNVVSRQHYYSGIA